MTHVGQQQQMFSEQERNAIARHEKEQRLFEASQPFIVRLTMLANMQKMAMSLTGCV